MSIFIIIIIHIEVWKIEVEERF